MMAYVADTKAATTPRSESLRQAVRRVLTAVWRAIVTAQEARARRIIAEQKLTFTI